MLLDGRRDEISHFQAKENESRKSERRAEGTNQIIAAKSTQKSQNCGRAPHQDNVCPAKGKACRNCGKFNHFARLCLSKAPKAGKNSRKRSNKHKKGKKSIRPLAHSDSESEGNIYIQSKQWKSVGPTQESKFWIILSTLWLILELP